MVGGRALLLMLGGIIVLSIMVGVAAVVMMVGMTLMSMVGGLLLSMTIGGVVPVIVVGVVFMVRSDVIEGFWVLWEIVQVIFMDGATFCAAQPVKPLYCVGHANNNVGTGSIVLLFFVCDYYSLYLLGVLYLFYP
jgi:hypothetical protein